MTKWIPGLVAIAILSACGAGNKELEQAKQAVTQVLSFRVDVKFRDLVNYPGAVVCGEFEEQNTMGGSYGFKRFIVRGGTADTNPREDDWQVFCSEDPATSLRQSLGISVQAEGSQLPQVQADLELLAAAIDAYQKDNYLLPSNPQGLPALVTRPRQLPAPRAYRQGGYLPSLPTDPWGQPYHYDNSSLGGSVGTYSLYTLGADKAPGGVGENADVDVRHLPYLQHIQALQE